MICAINGFDRTGKTTMIKYLVPVLRAMGYETRAESYTQKWLAEGKDHAGAVAYFQGIDHENTILLLDRGPIDCIYQMQKPVSTGWNDWVNIVLLPDEDVINALPDENSFLTDPILGVDEICENAGEWKIGHSKVEVVQKMYDVYMDVVSSCSWSHNRLATMHSVATVHYSHVKSGLERKYLPLVTSDVLSVIVEFAMENEVPFYQEERERDSSVTVDDIAQVMAELNNKIESLRMALEISEKRR